MDNWSVVHNGVDNSLEKGRIAVLNAVRTSLRHPIPQLLLGLAVLVFCTGAHKLSPQWLVPGGSVQIDQQLVSGTPLKVCALTFDDGPDEIYTAQVRRVLDSYGVKATFFIVGERAERHPEQIDTLLRSGHELGSHSFSHPAMARLSGAAQREELRRANQVLAGHGVQPRWFRPPFGSYGKETTRLARELGMETILWTVDAKDWAQPGVRTIEARVLRQVGPGAVILLHCTNPQTVAALPEIIEELAGRGYSFTTLTHWRDLVTGQAPPPRPGILAPQLPLAEAVGGPFFEPFTPGDTVPRIIEKLEDRSPSDRAHVLWSALRARAERSAVLARHGPPQRTAATGELGAAATAADEPGALLVYANFAAADELSAVFREGGSSTLHVFGKQPRIVAAVAAPPPAVEVQDTPVTPAGDLPALPPGEELVIPPDEEAGAPSAPGQVVQPEPAVTAPAEELPATVPPRRLSLRIIDLVDTENPATVWTPPASIETSDLVACPGGSAADPSSEPRFYFLAMVGDLERYTWVELDTYVRLAKLSGMVLPMERYYGQSPTDAPYPWAYVNLAYLDRAAWVDLTVEDTADVMEVIKRGKRHIFIVVRPSNLHFFIAAHLWAEMNRNMRDFVLFRQLTGGMQYVAGGAAADWELPRGVELARFSDGRREALVLYSQSYRPMTVRVPASASHYSLARIDAGGYLRIEPGPHATVVVDRSPAILYYEY